MTVVSAHEHLPGPTPCSATSSVEAVATALPRPVVSVVLPTFNRPHYLAQAIQSVLDQTFVHFEVIVTDNGDSAAVRRLVASFGDVRLRYRSNETNIGLLRNALAGWAVARGQYVATLHDDDLWDPAFLQKLAGSQRSSSWSVA